METQNFLADQVHVRGPIFFEFHFVIRVTHAGHVTRQRVRPHIENVFLLARPRDAPLEGSAADGKIAQPATHKRQHFIPARIGLDEIGLLFVKLEQAILKRGQFEKIILFADALGRPLAFRAKIPRQRLVDIHLVEDAILAFVTAFVNVTLILRLAEKHLHRAFVTRLGGANEAVDGQIEFHPQRAIF